jgi:hypothetical protein
MNKCWLIVVLASVSACSGVGSPNPRDVVGRINSYYSTFPVAIPLDIGHTGTKCFFPFNGVNNESPMDLGYRPETDLATIVAMSAGLIEVKPAGTNWWAISLTDKGQKFFETEHMLRQFHTVGYGCDIERVVFPVARAYVAEVAGPKTDYEQPDPPSYEYTSSWKWKVTELGEALRQDGKVYSRLSVEQRKELADKANPPSIFSAPHLSFPVPAETDNVAHPITAIIKKKNGGLSLDFKK